MIRKRIILTGGHAVTNALSTIIELKKRKDIIWDITWIGARHSFEGKSYKSSDFKIFSKRGIRFIPLYSGRIQRKFSLWTIPALLKIPIGFIHSLGLIITLRPNIIVSFGGFVSFPVVVIGWLFRVPIIVHEQTLVAGLANEISSIFANYIAIARKESSKYFPSKKVIFTGNPTHPGFKKVSIKRKIISVPTIFITGGSRGATFINNLIKEILDVLLLDYRVIHQTGEIDCSYFKNKLKGKDVHYRCYSYVDPSRMWKLYNTADIVISRAGANNVSEIMITKRPAILIPIPWSYRNEQMENALLAQNFGIARILPEDKATPESLLMEIKKVEKNWVEMIEKCIDKKSPDGGASEKLVDLIEKMTK